MSIAGSPLIRETLSGNADMRAIDVPAAQIGYV